jgi:hypothetical protein
LPSPGREYGSDVLGGNTVDAGVEFAEVVTGIK